MDDELATTDARELEAHLAQCPECARFRDGRMALRAAIKARLPAFQARTSFVPPPEEVPGLLDDLCDANNDDRLPPIVQAALVHAQFDTIHPFADGNGRVGRALIHVILKRRRMAPAYVPPISVVLAAGRDRYIEGLTRFRSERVNDWIEEFAAAARSAAGLAAAYLREVQQLTAAWRAKLSARAGPPRADAAAPAVIEALPGYPVISAPVAAARPVGTNTIHRDLGMFKAALNWACQKYDGGRRLLTRHALEKFKIPTEKDPKRPVLDADTIHALLEVAPSVHPFLRPLILLAWRTGRRLSSILALRWDDVDFESGNIRWRPEHHKIRQAWIVPMHPVVFDELRRFRAERPGIGSDVAAAGGWRDTTTLLRYQQPDEETLRRVVAFERPRRRGYTHSHTHTPRR